MNTSVERLEGDRARLTITVPSAEVDREISSAYSEIGSKLRIPGFRPGKAPRPVIDTHVGREAVLAQAQEAVINEAVPKALLAEDLRIVGQPDAGELDMIETGKDYTFSVEITLRPQLTFSSLDDLAATILPKTVSDREIDAQIEMMRDRFCSLEASDGAIAENDAALISFKGTVDGESYDGGEVDKYLYELGRGMMPKEFDDALIGVAAGGTTIAEFVVPDTSSNPEYVGKTARFDIEVHEVKKKVLPELDDEFAVSAGGFDTMEEYREDLREKMQTSRENTYEDAVRAAAIDALVDRLEGEVPGEMIQDRAMSMLRDIAAEMDERGISYETYLQATGETAESLHYRLGQQAAEALRQELALEALARQKELTVSDEDVDAAIVEMLGGDAEQLANMRDVFAASGALASLRDQVRYRKAIECLMSMTKITEEEAS